ncbi:MAG: 4Fe-4S dicluster domain-containing protein [Bacteroidales bacterium]|nr:4Fe-4S dicluster domain-containing protein [Bacteroidales bacterium]
MNTEIYYLSGTGNSLHVARELQKKISESKLIPIVRLLNNDVIKTNADMVGFIFPNFCLTIPIPIHEFLKKVDLSSAHFLFAICTRGGSQSEAFEYFNILLKRQGKKLHAQLDINMPWNYPFGKQNLAATSTEKNIHNLENKMQKRLDVFIQYIHAKEEYIEKGIDSNYKIPHWQKVLFSLIPKSFNYVSHRYMYQKLLRFYSDSNCTGCGVCEKICLSKKIELIGKIPVWKEETKCYACYACINFCPQQAIQIESKIPFVGSFTEINGRYHHKSITYKDIAKQR